MRLRKRKNLDARMEEAARWLTGSWKGRGSPRLIAELGCGMGRFACETAAARPDAFVIGVERDKNAVIIGMERAMRENLQNIRFIPGDVNDLEQYFEPGSIKELYIHFCDPWPHRKHAPRRLVSRGFLRIYRPLLAPGGFLKFKTDNAPLFAFARKELDAEGWTVIKCDPGSPPERVMTDYEMKFRELGAAIGMMTAQPGKVTL